MLTNAFIRLTWRGESGAELVLVASIILGLGSCMLLEFTDSRHWLVAVNSAMGRSVRRSREEALCPLLDSGLVPPLWG